MSSWLQQQPSSHIYEEARVQSMTRTLPYTANYNSSPIVTGLVQIFDTISNSSLLPATKSTAQLGTAQKLLTEGMRSGRCTPTRIFRSWVCMKHHFPKSIDRVPSPRFSPLLLVCIFMMSLTCVVLDPHCLIASCPRFPSLFLMAQTPNYGLVVV